MSRVLRRWVLTGAVAASAGSLAGLLALPACAAPRAAQARAAQGRVQVARAGGEQVAAVEQLKSEAFKALRSGRFDRTGELLGQAAELAHDPDVTRMADWAKTFESQRQTFLAERRKQYDKAVGEVKKLIDQGKGEFAIDRAARAYLLADDKKAFRAEPWVDQLIGETVRRAEAHDQGEQWLKALRLYSDLGSIEPANPLWKERLKLATRRVRLVALYTPDDFKALQESEQKESEAADAIINPENKPQKPEPDKGDDAVDNFRIDWRDTLRGIRMDMLWAALLNTRENYFREVGYNNLTLGGLKGLRALASTRGLDKAFPNLADEAKRERFLKAVDRYTDDAKDADTQAEQQHVLRAALAMLQTVNRQTLELPEEVLVSEFADGAFGELDPFSSMIWPSDLEEFNRTTQGEFSGVGIQIQSDEDGSLKVVSPLEDSPAYKAGIKSGDVVSHINGKNAKGITLNQAVKTITGPSGTTVVLTVRGSDSKVREYTIRRETIKVASIKGWLHRAGGGWDWLVDRENKIGYMRMTNFTKDTSKELDRAINQLKDEGARALILDLRYNPGGLLTAATEVTDKFLKEGVIVSTRPDRETGNQPTVASARRNADEAELPLVVLVNQYSASASEIVSGALKDQKRALVVGERTFGKGSVQMLFPLNDRSAYLKLTTSHYYLPSGRCIHREENSTEWGVDPDVTVEMTPEQMRAAIDARQDLDILRDANSPPAEGEQRKLEDVAPEVRDAVKDAGKEGGAEGEVNAASTPKEKKDLLSSDPQLSAGVLLLRLQLAGAELL